MKHNTVSQRHIYSDTNALVVFSCNLVGYISKSEVSEGHASVSPQRDAVMIAGETKHLTVHLEQLCHCLQPTCRENSPKKKKTDHQDFII